MQRGDVAVHMDPIRWRFFNLSGDDSALAEALRVEWYGSRYRTAGFSVLDRIDQAVGSAFDPGGVHER